MAVIDDESTISDADSNEETDRGDAFDHMAAKTGEQRPRSGLVEFGGPRDVADSNRAVSIRRHRRRFTRIEVEDRDSAFSRTVFELGGTAGPADRANGHYAPVSREWFVPSGANSTLKGVHWKPMRPLPPGRRCGLEPPLNSSSICS